MARDLETLLAKVRKSLDASRAMVEVTRQMVENSRRLLGGHGKDSTKAPAPAEKEKPDSEAVGDSPQEASGQE